MGPQRRVLDTGLLLTRLFALKPIMQESSNILELVRSAEAAVEAEVRAAEERRRRAVADAGAGSRKAVADVRARLQQESAAAVRRAEEEAGRLAAEAAESTRSEAAAISGIVQDRVDRAASSVVAVLKKRWRSSR